VKPLLTLFALTLASLAPAEDAKPFEFTGELLGIGFKVDGPAGTNATLTLTPSGLAEDNRAVSVSVTGTVRFAELADLNADGSPEIYISLAGPGPESRGQLIAYSANRRKSLSDIFLPPLEDSPGATKGYRGRDEFRVVENTLVRRFPVFRDGDAPGQPTGGTRQLQYKLHAGEAGWVLRVDKVVDY
jgi:hypothetical protein